MFYQCTLLHCNKLYSLLRSMIIKIRACKCIYVFSVCCTLGKFVGHTADGSEIMPCTSWGWYIYPIHYRFQVLDIPGVCRSCSIDSSLDLVVNFWWWNVRISTMGFLFQHVFLEATIYLGEYEFGTFSKTSKKQIQEGTHHLNTIEPVFLGMYLHLFIVTLGGFKTHHFNSGILGTFSLASCRMCLFQSNKIEISNKSHRAIEQSLFGNYLFQKEWTAAVCWMVA